MPLFGMRKWGLAGSLLVFLGCSAGLLGADAADPLTPQQRQELEKQFATKQHEADRAEASEDFASARQARQAVLELCRRLHGEQDWRVTDARLGVAQGEILAKLTATQRQQLREAGQLIGQGSKLDQAGKYREAAVFLERALAIRQGVLGEDHLDTAQSYNYVANNLNAQLKYAEADPLYRRALAVNQKVRGEDHPQTAVIDHNLASNLDAQGKYAEAEPLYRRALTSLQKARGEDHPETAGIYNRMANNLQGQGQYAAAESHYRRALAIFQKVLGENHAETAIGYHNLAFNLNAQGRYAEAEPFIRRALDIQLKALGEDHADTASSYQTLASNLAAQGQYTTAELLYRRALDIQLKVLGKEHSETAASYQFIGGNLNAQSKYAEADVLLRCSLAICQKVLGENHPQTADSYNRVAYNLDDLGKYAEAESLYRRALAIRQNVLGENHIDTETSYTNVAYNLNAQGRYAEALKLAEAAARSFETTRLRVSFGGLERATYSKQSPLPLFAALLARAHQPTAAWQALEKNLARGLLDDLHARHTRALTAAESRRHNQLRSLIDHLDQQSLALAGLKEASPTQQHREELRQQLLARQREYAEFRADLARKYGPAAGAVYDFPRIQQHVPADAALLAWLDRSVAADPKGDHWACLVRPSGMPIWVQLAGTGPGGAWTKEDTDVPRQLRDLLLQTGNDGERRRLTDRLHAQRLAPLIPHLAGVKHLIILASPALAGIPIETLTDLYSISYAPSGTLFAYLQEKSRQTRPTAGKLLALGDPAFLPAPIQLASAADLVRSGTRDRFAPLPGSRREVERIARCFPLHDTLLGSAASEQRLAALASADQFKQYRYLHFATHGQADPERGLRSFLALAQDNLPDSLTMPEPGERLATGRLSAADILRDWQLDADLVTLSACETGLGQQQGGEGYVGFAQALFLAGARSLVLSQWKVDDDATALLMVRFYQDLLGQRAGLAAPLGKAAALAEAKAWLRHLDAAEVRQLKADLRQGSRGSEETRPAEGVEAITGDRPYQHPYYWAGFILVGDPGDLTAARPVLAQGMPVEAASPDGLGRWWLWLIGCAVVGSGLVGGLVWRQRRRPPVA